MITSSTYSGGMLITNYDNSKMFLGDNNHQDEQVNNSDYADLVMPTGTLMGRISGTGLLVPLESGAADGSQLPVGVMSGGFTVVFGATDDVRVCIGGEIDQAGIVFQGADTLETVVGDRQLRDWLQLAGFILRVQEDLSELDNQ